MPQKSTLAKLSIYKTPKYFSKHLPFFICAKKFAVEIGINSRKQSDRLRHFNYCSFFVPKAKPMNNLTSMTLFCLKKLFYQKLCFICIWQPYALQILRTYNPLAVLFRCISLEFQEAAAHQLLENYIVKDLYPCPLATCK
jgi:hypothetical protein